LNKAKSGKRFEKLGDRRSVSLIKKTVRVQPKQAKERGEEKFDSVVGDRLQAQDQYPEG